MRAMFPRAMRPKSALGRALERLSRLFAKRRRRTRRPGRTEPDTPSVEAGVDAVVTAAATTASGRTELPEPDDDAVDVDGGHPLDQ